MTDRQTVKRLATAIAAGGVFAIAPVAIPAASAAPADCPGYAVNVITSTDLSISPANPDVGETFTATLTVLAGGQPVNGGTVNFVYNGLEKTDTVKNGTASTTFDAAGGSFEVRARFAGQCFDNGTAFDPSTDTQPIVAGVEAFAGSGNGGGAARPGATLSGVSGSGGSGSAVGGLASTGLDNQTELYGLLGLGLVTVGGLTLMVHRRRVQG